MHGDMMIRATNDIQMSINLGCFAAWGLWTVSLLVLAWGTWDGNAGAQVWGLVFTGWAMVATIRQHFVYQNRWMRDLFELGVDAGKAEGATPLRR